MRKTRFVELLSLTHELQSESRFLSDSVLIGRQDRIGLQKVWLFVAYIFLFLIYGDLISFGDQSEVFVAVGQVDVDEMFCAFELIFVGVILRNHDDYSNNYILFTELYWNTLFITYLPSNIPRPIIDQCDILHLLIDIPIFLYGWK